MTERANASFVCALRQPALFALDVLARDHLDHFSLSGWAREVHGKHSSHADGPLQRKPNQYHHKGAQTTQQC